MSTHLDQTPHGTGRTVGTTGAGTGVAHPDDAIGPPAAATRTSVGTRAFLLLSLAAGAVASGPMAEWTTVSYGGHGAV